MTEWTKKTIAECAANEPYSTQIGPFGKVLTPEEYTLSGVPLLRGVNVNSGRFYDDGFVFISEETANRLYKYESYPDDVLLVHKGTLGQIGLMPKNRKYHRYIMGNSMLRVKCDQTKLIPEYLYYWLCSREGQHYLLSRVSQVGVPQIQKPLATLREASFLVPPLNEQKAITDILETLDRKIENLRRQNETLEAIAQTLFKHWFIDFEFPDADGKPYKSSGGGMWRSAIGDIPEGWRVGTLGDVVDVNSQSIDKNYPHKVIKYVDISSVGIGTLENTTQYKLSEAPSRARRLVKHGDVIWSGVRPNRKSYLFICNPTDNLVVSTGFIVLSPKQIPSSYLYAWVTTSLFVDYLTLNASGSAYPAVKAEHFEIAEIILPSKAILGMFHSIVDPMRIKTYENSLQIQTLTKTRDALLPKLMSGQLRIEE
jgi:type I restriction enzyme S subunit